MTNLGSYLQTAKIKQSAFAASISVDQATVSKLCRGKIQPSLELAFRIERQTRGAVQASSWVIEEEDAS